MTDISKCQGSRCEIKDTCWRFLAPAGYYQSYIEPERQGEGCSHYWQAHSKSVQRRLATQTKSDK